MTEKNLFKIIADLEKQTKNIFCEELNINNDDLLVLNNKKIKLPCDEIKLITPTFLRKSGEYNLNEIMEIYFNDSFNEGLLIGLKYAEMYLIEYINEKNLTKDEIKNINPAELEEYIKAKV